MALLLSLRCKLLHVVGNIILNTERELFMHRITVSYIIMVNIKVVVVEGCFG